jgi:ribosomal protein S8
MLPRSSAAPAGYTLGAFTWFIDQTIGGAVATGSHGSSMVHGSLSSQVSAWQANMGAVCAQILEKEGFISNFQISADSKNLVLRLKYRYNILTTNRKKESCITNLKRISKPGLRIYTNSKEIPKVLVEPGDTCTHNCTGLTSRLRLCVQLPWHMLGPVNKSTAAHADSPHITMLVDENIVLAPHNGAGQVAALTYMDASGAIQRITPESHPHLFRALGVSVGRLGLLLQLSFHIVPNKDVARSKQDVQPDAFVAALQQLQKDYTGARAAGAAATSRRVWDVLQPWNDRQVSGCGTEMAGGETLCNQAASSLAMTVLQGATAAQ